MEFDDGPHLFFDAGPNKPGDSTGGLFGVIHAAGDQDRDDGGALLGCVQAQPTTSPSPAPAAGSPSASAAGSSQAVPPVSKPAGLAPGMADYRVSDQVFADLEGTESVARALTADAPWAW
jgi:hypothetical protein